MSVSVMKRINHEPGVAVVHSCLLNPERLSSSPAWVIKQEEAWLKTQTEINAATNERPKLLGSDSIFENLT